MFTYRNAIKFALQDGGHIFSQRPGAIQQLTQQSRRTAGNLSAVLVKHQDIKCEERDIPKPNPHELLLKVQTVGVCGTDVHFWKTGKIGPLVIDKPLILGHEATGIVADVGEQVKGFSIGDRIAIEPGIPCRRCDMCRHGHYNLCMNMQFFGVPPKDGTFRQYITHEADFCFKLPDNISMEEGSLLEPLSVSLYACRDAQVTAASKVVVLGAGPIGLTTVLSAKAYGATRICVTDVVPERLKIAKEIGAEYPINVKDMSVEEAAKTIIEDLGGPADMAIECCGFDSSIATAIKSVKNGGKVILVALAKDVAPVPVSDIVAREIKLNGVFAYTNTWPTAIELVRTGRIKLDKLTTAKYSLEQAQAAFEKSVKGEVVKVFVECNKD